MTPTTSTTTTKTSIIKDKIKSLYDFSNNILYHALVKEMADLDEDYYEDGLLLLYCQGNPKSFFNNQYKNTTYYIRPLHAVFIKGVIIENILALYEFPNEKFKITEQYKRHIFKEPPTKPFWIKVILHKYEYKGHPYYNKSIIPSHNELEDRITIEEDGEIVCNKMFEMDEFDDDYNYIGKSVIYVTTLQNSDTIEEV
jgi:hypothetical protein